MENDVINIKSNYLDGPKLYFGIKAGINNLFEYQNKLDEINVFPVPDGDTGTNMCFTLLPIVEYPHDNIPSHTGEVFNIIADLALESARGNSGTIIAQFLHGLRRACRSKDIINVSDFSKALISGYDSAIESLMKPEEGTIITVMRDVAEKSKELSLNEEISFENFLDKCYQESVISLEKTKISLEKQGCLLIASENQGISSQNPRVPFWKTLGFPWQTRRISSENTRISVVNPRISLESPRISSENPRISLERPRISSENPRISCEIPRISSENPRISSENPRISSENPRNSSENPRVSSENPRISRETRGFPRKTQGFPRKTRGFPRKTRGFPW